MYTFEQNLLRPPTLSLDFRHVYITQKYSRSSLCKLHLYRGLPDEKEKKIQIRHMEKQTRLQSLNHNPNISTCFHLLAQSSVHSKKVARAILNRTAVSVCRMILFVMKLCGLWQLYYVYCTRKDTCKFEK